MKLLNVLAAALSAIFLSGQQPLYAQETPADEQTVVVVPLEQDRGPEDALNRGTPRGAAVGFLEACEEPKFEKAAEYLIKAHCYLKTTDYTESLQIGEALNLSMMEIVQLAGARFALPGRFISLEGEAVVAPG